jgi:hypothetical protein
MKMDKDIELLREFVLKVYLWLNICYLSRGDMNKQSPWTVIPVRQELRELAEPAWVEFSREYPLEKLLRPITKEREGVLKSHGLYGAQLRYKLHLVELASRNAQLGILGWRKKLIELIDNILDSLDPTGLAGGLKELKDALAGSLPDE